MPKVTKAELSRILHISKARVSQYVQHGLPVLEDGKVDLDVATRWVAENFGHDERQKGKGTDRAKAIVKSKPAPALSTDLVTVDTLNGLDPLELLCPLVKHGGELAARFVIEAGGSAQLAWCVEHMLSAELYTLAEEALPRIDQDRISGASDWPWGKVDWREIDKLWTERALASGETFDIETWDKFMTSLPSQQGT